VGLSQFAVQFLSEGVCCLLVEGLLICADLFPVPNHCLLEGFSVGGVAYKSEVLLMFSFEGFHPWKNCPTVLFHRYQTLEV
jgi:hypothetical protein